jgi:RNA polymerase sigma factor (sigma-70 family)
MKSFLKVIKLYQNNDALIKKAANNNREAQQALFEMYAPKMLSVCRYYITDLHFAEDVMLHGFFKVFTHLKSFKNEGSFEGWIRRIMVRESISFLRKQKNIEFSIDDLKYENDYDDSLNTTMDVADIQKIIDGLSEGYRIVFVMYAIEGYKHHEIASMLNITEGTSKSQLFKARKILQEKINSINTPSYGSK